MQVLENFYIDGAWVPASGDDVFEVIDSATEEVVATVPAGTPADVDAAVAAARAAFDTWSNTPVDIRAKYLRDIGAGLAARFEEIVDVISTEVGSPKTFAQMVQTGLAVGEWESFAQLVENYEFEETVGNSLVVREPIGVVGAITPWNYPLYLIICKVVPALASGCTVVLKPSEITPLNAYLLAEVIDEVGLPAGVFNLVVGTGPVVGEAISTHPDIDMVSFTGSGRSGAEVTKAAADTVKRVGLELGGKSANIVLDDADPAAVAMGGVFGCIHQLRPDLPGADPAAGARVPQGRVHRRGRRRGRQVPAGRPEGRRARHLPLPRPAVLEGASGAGAQLHPQGHRRGRDAASSGDPSSPRSSPPAST